MERFLQIDKWVVGLITICGLVSAAAIAINLYFITSQSSPVQKRPHLLLITLDNLRSDHLNIYGYARNTSPALTQLAEGGYVFDNVFTVATNSGPSHATLLTGLYPFEHGLLDNGQRINPDTPTLAEHLRPRGYDTAGFVGYYALGRESGLDKGFKTFEYHKVKSHDHGEKNLADDVAGFKAVQGWLESWMKKTEKPGEGENRLPEPFFIWMHVQNIHESYDPPAPYDSLFGEMPGIKKLAGFGDDFNVRCANDLAEAWRDGVLPDYYKEKATALYDGEIRLVDDHLKILFNTLRASGLYDDTLIVVVADHGEVLFEVYENNFFSKGPGHTARYYDPAIRVPLIIKPARSTQSGPVHLPQMVSTLGLAPTLLDLLGLDPPFGMSGESLVPLMKNPQSANLNAKIFIQESPEAIEFAVVRTKKWKFAAKNDRGKNDYLLVNLQDDPLENKNVAAGRESQTQELHSLLARWRENLKPVRMTSSNEMTEKMQEELRAGGYIRD